MERVGLPTWGDTMRGPRFQVGSFVKRRKEDQIYCVYNAFRREDMPNEWQYTLEERKDMGDPSTPMSLACEAALGRPMKRHGEIIWEPLTRYSQGLRVDETDYGFGNRIIETNRTLLNNYVPITRFKA